MAEYDLTKEEKASIIMTHLKSLSSNKYNLEISLDEENSLPSPSQETIDQLNSQVQMVEAKTAALVDKLRSVLG
jgi:hypothetical protein